MLETLRIQNYALIDAVEVDFSAGFNVLTGETGAGKSIVVGALNLVLGARASAELVRAGASKASIDAVFRLPRPGKRVAALLREAEIECDGELILTRTIGADGRSRGYVNGTMVPVTTLAALGDELIDLHGQHEHQSLMKPDRQLDLLDAFAGAEECAEAVARAVARLHTIERQLRALESDDRERARRVEFLRFELSEIEAAGLEPGEEESVKNRRGLITNAEHVCELASSAYAALYDADGAAAIDRLDAATRDMEKLAELDSQFKTLVEQLASARVLIDEVSSEVRRYSEGIEFDPEELETLNRRIALIGSLKRKYGESVEAILAYAEQARAELAQYDRRDESLAALQREHAEALAEAQRLAAQLSETRRATAAGLARKVRDNLQHLGMKGGVFETHFETVGLCASGVDRIEFMLSANLGEKVKPLRQVASGGEISRVMLALKAVLAQADRVPTLVFDEIDAGVGGAVAAQVGKKLRELSANHQVICITHLAQIAAQAATHFTVAKATAKGRTTTALTRVEKTERVEELARLLDGSVSDVSLKHARALLREA